MASLSEIKAAAEKEIQSRGNDADWAKAVAALRDMVPDWPQELVRMAEEIQRLRGEQ